MARLVPAEQRNGRLRITAARRKRSRALGYGGSKPDAAERVGRSGDGGIDGVIREDTLGLDAIYVQTKKWAPERGIDPREIREFLGALQDIEATKGIFITTSSFSTGDAESIEVGVHRGLLRFGVRRT